MIDDQLIEKKLIRNFCRVLATHFLSLGDVVDKHYKLIGRSATYQGV